MVSTRSDPNLRSSSQGLVNVARSAILVSRHSTASSTVTARPVRVRFFFFKKTTALRITELPAQRESKETPFFGSHASKNTSRALRASHARCFRQRFTGGYRAAKPRLAPNSNEQAFQKLDPCYTHQRPARFHALSFVTPDTGENAVSIIQQTFIQPLEGLMQFSVASQLSGLKSLRTRNTSISVISFAHLLKDCTK